MLPGNQNTSFETGGPQTTITGCETFEVPLLNVPKLSLRMAVTLSETLQFGDHKEKS